MVQILRRLLAFGIPRLEHPQVKPFFLGLLQRMAGISAALQRVQGQISGQAGNAVEEGGVVPELQELWEKMAATAVDAQKDHPIGFYRSVKPSPSLFGYVEGLWVIVGVEILTHV